MYDCPKVRAWKRRFWSKVEKTLMERSMRQSCNGEEQDLGPQRNLVGTVRDQEEDETRADTAKDSGGHRVRLPIASGHWAT